MSIIERQRSRLPLVGAGRRRRFAGWNQPRLARTLVLASWAGAFWFLLISGRVPLYLSSRTAWLVPVGAVALSVTTIGGLVTARASSSQPLRRRELVALSAILVPAVLLAFAAPTTLGSFSADRKPSFAGSGLWTYWGTFDQQSDITLFFVAAAQYWPDAGELLARRAGEEVSFVGFVDRDPDTPADELLLTRFVVSCCVADAATVQLRVVDAPPGGFAVDEWVQVRGRIYPVGSQIIVTAESIEPVAAPSDPYLTAT